MERTNPQTKSIGGITAMQHRKGFSQLSNDPWFYTRRWSGFHPEFLNPSDQSITSSTYRVQMSPLFGFEDLISILPMLRSRSVESVYLSPITTPQPGSMHGYDVINHHQINPELGGEEGFLRLVSALKKQRMGIVIDVVPNHMSIDRGNNSWWQDVLKNGRESAFAEYFEIFYEESSPQGKINLLFLGAPLEEVIRNKQLCLVRDPDGSHSFLAYDSTSYPINNLGQSAISEKLKVATLDDLNADTDFLLSIHSLQYYQLLYWRQIEKINYSRFFAIKELARLRVENPTVFAAVHAGVLGWTKILADSGVAVAWRIDHPDGLVDPRRYFQWVRQALSDVVSPGIILIAEKILTDDECIPTEWLKEGVAASVGYDFIKQANDIALSPRGVEELNRRYREFTGRSEIDFAEIQFASYAQILTSPYDLKPEYSRCARYLIEALETESSLPKQRALEQALLEFLAQFPVYRTYIGQGDRVSTRDRCYIEEAFLKAKRHGPTLVDELQKIRDLLLAGSNDAKVSRFVQYFQRISGPARAKSFEDTALYRDVIVSSLYEVGGNPTYINRVADYHQAMIERVSSYPLSLLALSTHDTKRGLDTRMRAAALTHLAPKWNDWLNENVQANSRFESLEPKLHRSDIWLLYMTIISAAPQEWAYESPASKSIEDFCKRIELYMLKALCEAKERTFWVKPEGKAGDECTAYEQATIDYIRKIFGDASFLQRLISFFQAVVDVSIDLGLGQLVLSVTSPGITEIYQGGFDWNTSLVDPDNRRQVDHFKVADAKSAMMANLLKERSANPDVFVGGGYEPVRILGSSPDCMLSFRRYGNIANYITAIVLKPGAIKADCFLSGLLPSHSYLDVLSKHAFVTGVDGTLAAIEILDKLPAVLLRE